MTTAKQPNSLFRIAIRAEGQWINAYLADNETMTGAVLMGTIRRSMCDNYPELFPAWHALMRQYIAYEVERQTGVRPDFGIERAPEHERSGSG